MRHAIPPRWVLIVPVLALNSSAIAQEPATSENTARVRAHSITVREGTGWARIPVTITSDHAEQTLAGFQLALRVGLDSAPVPIIDHDEMLNESIFVAHPHVIQGVLPLGRNGVRVYQLAWLKPFGTVKADGVVAVVAVDTSQLAPGKYPIVLDTQQMSAVATTDGSLYHNVTLSEEHGELTVVPAPETTR